MGANITAYPTGVISPRVEAALDWHDPRSRFLLDLDERLERAVSDADRTALPKRLSKGLTPR